MEARALAVGLLAALEPGPVTVTSGVSGLLRILGRLDFLKSLRESFQLVGIGWDWDWLRLVLAVVVDLSLIKEEFVDFVVLFCFDFDLALAIISPDDPSSSSSEPSFWPPESLKLAEEDANRILSTRRVGFFMAADFILLTNLGLSMDGLGNFFTDLRALMTT